MHNEDKNRVKKWKLCSSNEMPYKYYENLKSRFVIKLDRWKLPCSPPPPKIRVQSICECNKRICEGRRPNTG